MKCEICHKADAETAIHRGEGDAEDELYVCKACAKVERQKRQKRSQRTRKMTGLPPGMSMSITEIHPVDDGDGESDGDDDSPVFASLLDAVNGMVSDFEKAVGEAAAKGKKSSKDSAPAEEKLHSFPLGRIDQAFRIRSHIHLEGLSLIGELDAVKRAFRALDIDLRGLATDGVSDVGHVYSVFYSGSVERVKRVVEDLLREERNARVRLFEELPRVFGDSLCRALAILKNCRLLSPGEFFDLLSPLRLAAQEKMLDGIDIADIEKLLLETDLSGAEDKLEPDERDRVDAERADEMNRLFEDVMLNERADGKFL